MTPQLGWVRTPRRDVYPVLLGAATMTALRVAIAVWYRQGGDGDLTWILDEALHGWFRAARDTIGNGPMTTGTTAHAALHSPGKGRRPTQVLPGLAGEHRRVGRRRRPSSTGEGEGRRYSLRRTAFACVAH